MSFMRPRTSNAGLMFAIGLVSAVVLSCRAARQDSPKGTARKCGVCFAHSSEAGGSRGYGSEDARSSLDELKQLGISHLSVTPFGYLPALDSSEVRGPGHYPGEETPTRVRAVTHDAHARGQTVMLKPHLWVGGGAWPGELAPSSPDAVERFFRTYRDFILSWATVAAETKAESFLIGVELRALTAAHPAKFRALIADVRRVYSGRLGYGANWDEVLAVEFWDELDFIGVQLYAPLRDAAEPLSIEALRAHARAWLSRYTLVATRTGKPLYLTEIGFTNRVGVTLDPHVWPEQKSALRTDGGDEEQRLAYEAILSTFGESPLVERIYIWKWFTDVNTDEERAGFGFMPRGKPAAASLARFCGGPLPASPSAGP